ncbi:redoxin domain-containing protein [Candidatus Laterigemmans baculatus]|uniref:redoxin domain-containing protein n=1 Tax=Candidatus Laterigemmans baculatus TaxID=2770505 RepID=UPI0013DD612F|nr:redoxin domain-containing protein [Candidatus Laterigemmans baculatus]
MRKSCPPTAPVRRASRHLWAKLLVVPLLAGPLFVGQASTTLAQDDAAPTQAQPAQPPASEQPAPADAAAPAAAKISDEVRAAVAPMVRRIAAAESLRATVKMTVTSAVADEVLGTTEGLFQIASVVPNKIALSAKFESEAVRFVSGGQQLNIQLSPEAYVQTDAPESLAALVSAMPIQLGPQPEPMLWLSVAGVDPSVSLLNNVVSVELVGREPVGDVPAVQVRAKRREGMDWTLSIAADDRPRPLTLLIDMTEMITKANDLEVPEGYSFSIRYDFEGWEVDPKLAPELFTYQPPTGAEKFDSIADYLLQASEAGPHPLLGKPAPELEAQPVEGEAVTIGGQSDEVVVLEFWATWCAPCVEAMPKMAELARSFEGKKVKFYAVNVSEDREAVETFLEDRELAMPVLLDPEGEIASAYAATAIPQTVLIGKGGRVEAVHVGFDANESTALLTQELETLLAGRRIYEPEEVAEPKGDAEANPKAADEQPAEASDQPAPADNAAPAGDAAPTGDSGA